MEKDFTTRYIAIVEKCAMTEVALRHILINESGKNYRIQFFQDTKALKREFQSKDFSAIIFSLSGNRRSRLESLLFLHEIARYCPDTQRIILTNEGSVCQKQSISGQILSPTEHTILRYMSYGYSLPEIATQLERNIKTIRAHKFNAMTKLGVSSDMGLLSAADILMRLSANNDDARVMRLAQ